MLTRPALARAVRRYALALDVLLGLVVGVVGVLSLWSETALVDYDFREPDLLGVLLATACGAGVAARSRVPVLALLTSGAAALGLVVLGYPPGLGGLAPLLVLFSVAVRRDERTSAASAVFFAVVTAVALRATPFEPGVGDWLVNTLVLVTAWALGVSVRRRRAEIEGLEERNRALVEARDATTQAVLAAERSRVAREMQDLVAHGLTAVTVQAAAARRLLHRDPATAEQLLLTVEREGRAALEELRRVLGVLDPAAAAELRPQPGLDDVHDLVAQAREQGLDVALAVVGEPVPVEPGVALAAYRLVQEAVGNAAQHAGRARVRVELHWTGGGLDVVVEDDGRGSPGWSSGERGGRGLQAVRDRVDAYGGRLCAGPRGGGGFTVRASLPVAGSRP